MTQEQINDITSWWNEKDFPGKELFSIDEEGKLTITSQHIKEHVVGVIVMEGADQILKNLQDKFLILEMRVKELEIEWLNTEDKLKLVEKVEQLKESLLIANAVGDFEKLMPVVLEWEQAIHNLQEENFQKKLKLTGEAETLKDNNQWKETTIAFKEIGEKWKQSGYLDKTRNDALWNRIEAARKVFYDRKKVHNDEEEKEMLQNLDLKMELVEKAESLAQSDDWKSVSESFHKLTDEWKTIGRTMNKKNEELWQRLMSAKSVFFDRKRKHFEEIKQEQDANYTLKLALVEKAESLKDSTEWQATSQAYASIMEEWKKIGRVPHDKSDELWNRFTAAQDVFFDAKKRNYEETKSMLDANYKLKLNLLNRAIELKNSTSWGRTTDELNKLMDEWKKIGPVPRSESNKMWDDFIAARKHFFARKDANREQQKQYAEAQVAVRAEREKQNRQQLLDEIKEEEEKLEDFTNGIQNITPGKKAEQLRKHLENLIKESTEKLDRLRKKAGINQETVEE